MDGLDDDWDESFIDELIRAHGEAVAFRNPNPTPAPTPAPFDPFAAAVSYLPAAASYPPSSDEWDESFLDELIRAHGEAVFSRNPNPTPAPTPAPFDPFAAAVSYLPAAASYTPSAAAVLPLSHIAAAPHASVTASAFRFSPPRGLTQHQPPASVAASGSEILALVPAFGGGGGFSLPCELSQRPPAEESNCEIVGVAGPAGGDRFRGGAVRREKDAREAERREVERLKCPNGHTICSNCKHRVENYCPTCHQELGNIRCLALEKVAESLLLPCKYQSLGCTEIHPYQNKVKHEDLCRFRPYNCPYACSECLVTGDVPMLVSHLINDHKVDLHEGCTFKHRYVESNPYEVGNATWMLTVSKCFGQHFCLHFESFMLGMAPVYMAFLRFMGEDSDARNFSYSLEVVGSGRKLAWQGKPRSIRDGHKKARDSFDGLIIHRNMALFFSGSNRQELKLRVTGRIWKEQ